MDVERWQQLSPLLDVLLELEGPARAARLQALRDSDPVLAGELEALLALEDDSGDFLAGPMIEKPDTHLQSGTLVGPYRLETLLGEGGMGMVWLAIRADGLYQRRVALKLLRPGLADPNLRLRFTREREILARLEHPNIARLLDAGVNQLGQPYLALEYVEGIAITDYVRQHNLSVDQCLGLFTQICEAVSHAHANLIVHRDLKPSNILVTPAGEVRLLDFGIAKLLDDNEAIPLHPRTEVRAFTLHYAAPEQIRGELVTTRTDVYSLGVVLYELLARTKPYRLRRQTDAEWEEAILAVEPLRPSIAIQRNEDGSRNEEPHIRRDARRLRGDLDNIVLKALAKLPEHRYHSVEALALDLHNYLQGHPVSAQAQKLGYRAAKYVSRHRWGIAASSLVGLALVAALGVSLWKNQQATRETQRAQALQNFVIGLFDNAGVAQQGQLYDARAMLEAGERRGERELAQQPLAHAELMGVIARLYLGLGEYRRALQLLQKQTGLLVGLPNVPNSLALQSATLHGRVLRLLDQPDKCVQLMAPSEPSWPRLQQLLPAQTSAFLTELGRCQRGIGEFQAARSLFERSQAIRKRENDHVGIAENDWQLAAINQDLGNLDEAMRGYRAARDYLALHAGSRQPVAVDIDRSIGTLQRNQGDTDEATQSYQRAGQLASELHGPDHPVTVALRRRLAALQVDRGQFHAADQQLRKLHLLTVASLGANNHETASSWNSMGITAWQLGDLKRAIDLSQRAVGVWRQVDATRELSAGLFNYSMILHSSGREDEALAALQESRQLRVNQFGASHALVGETDRMLGEVLAAKGHMTQASAHFERAESLTRVNYGQDHPRSLFASLSLARQWGRLGQRSEALKRMDALALQQGHGSEIPRLQWSARAYADEIRCVGPQRHLAQQNLDRLLAELSLAQPDGGVIPREVQAIRARCI